MLTETSYNAHWRIPNECFKAVNQSVLCFRYTHIPMNHWRSCANSISDALQLC